MRGVAVKSSMFTYNAVSMKIHDVFRMRKLCACRVYNERIMAEKVGKTSVVGMKSMPMKLFATWEVEKTSPNCIPRYMLSISLVVVLAQFSDRPMSPSATDSQSESNIENTNVKHSLRKM